MHLVSFVPPIVYDACFFFFFFNDTATTEIYTLSLHDALPIFRSAAVPFRSIRKPPSRRLAWAWVPSSIWCGASGRDRKSTRLNSSHQIISYAVFCLKKKKIQAGGVRLTVRSANVVAVNMRRHD